jgi:poly(3-hydroxybutyrate) depolymerase
MEVSGERVDPAAIRDIGLMTVEGEMDDISCPGQTHAAHGLCTNVPNARRQHLLVPGCGHYGIFSGSRWRNIIYPEIRAFIASQAVERSASTRAAKAVPAKSRGVTKANVRAGAKNVKKTVR